MLEPVADSEPHRNRQQRSRKRNRVERLLAVAKRFDNLLILAHNNPDPDCLASCLALQSILATGASIEAPIVYGGIVARPENRAMVRTLEIELTPVEEIEFRKFDGIALVDTQPGHGNNALPSRRRASIVIDHHSAIEDRSMRAPYCDVRSEIGATSTILTEYLFEAGQTITPRLATALFYGIKSDTLDLGRETAEADVEAYRRLFPLVDRDKLALIQHPPLPWTYFRDLRIAIANAQVYNDVIISSLEETSNPDMVPEVADLLLRLDGMHWAISLGRFEGSLFISVRSNDPRALANRLVRRVVGKRGTAGGHGMLAAGRVPLAAPNPRLETHIRNRFLKLLGARDAQPKPLIQE